MDYEFHDGSFRRIGKFVDVRRISQHDGGEASGGFGTTYIAYDPRGRRNVVLKEFYPGDIAWRDDLGRIQPAAGAKTMFDQLREKFVNEAHTLTLCEFPNVVTMYELLEFESAQNAFMVMQLVKDDPLPKEAMAYADFFYEKAADHPDRAAPTLGELVAFQRPDFKRFADIFYRLLDVVEKVHAREIVHRDIKPANVMMPLRHVDGTKNTYRRSPVLIDFGASRKTASGSKRAASVIYTPGYAPPEQMNPDGREGEATDIFALAATAYFALSGRHPDEGMLPENKPAGYFLTAVGGTCPPQFAAAMEWALRRDPAARPQSVSQWREQLPDLAPRQVVVGGVTRRQVALAAAGIGGIALAGGLAWWSLIPGPPETVTTSPRKPVAGPAGAIGLVSAVPGGQVALAKGGAVFATNERTSEGQRLTAGVLGEGNAPRALYRSGQEPSLGQCVVPLDDGGMIVGGCWGDPPYKALVVRLRADGTEVWNRSPDAGAINRIALADNRIHVVCGSPEAEDSATRAKLHVFDMDGGEQGSGFDLSVRPHESVSRVAVLDAERVLTLSQRSRPNGMVAGVLAGYRLKGSETTDLWPAWSDEKWLNDKGFRASQPTDIAVVNGEVFVAGILIAGDDAKASYSPYLLRFDGEHGALRWARPQPFGDERSPWPIRTVALALAGEGSERRLFAAYCLAEPDGSYRQSRVVQVGPDGEALASAIVGSADQPFAIQSLAADADGGMALGYAPDGSVLVRRLSWQG